MSKELHRIEKALDQMGVMLKRQSDDLQYLREQIQHIVQVMTPKPVPVVIDPECGYEWIGVHIRLDAQTWSRIKAGEHIKIKGKGWVPEEDFQPDPADELFHWDHWEFNGGIGKPMKITMESPHEEFMDLEDAVAYEGPLLSRYVHELNP
jgi:hypothetical protein